MLITLFCDASFCSNTGAVGYGAWAKKDDWEKGLIFGGEIAGTHKQAAEAELSAIANSVVFLSERGDLGDIDAVIIQSDCTRALELMVQCMQAGIRNHVEGAKLNARPSYQMSKPEQRAIKSLRETLGPVKCRLFVRHVRGHRHGENRQWVNRMCDLEAKKHMRRSREKLSSAPCT